MEATLFWGSTTCTFVATGEDDGVDDGVDDGEDDGEDETSRDDASRDDVDVELLLDELLDALLDVIGCRITTHNNLTIIPTTEDAASSINAFLSIAIFLALDC
jgi:hypothetical protein